MPFYRYECRNCGHEFRHLHFNDSSEQPTCPKCESKDLERQPPRVAVQFKGSGYYKTDRANKKSKAGTKGLSDKETSSESTPGESKAASEPRESKSSTSDSSSKTN